LWQCFSELYGSQLATMFPCTIILDMAYDGYDYTN